MKATFKRLSAIGLVVLLSAGSLLAQNRRPATPRRSPPQVAEPPPTFDTLLGEDTYRIYFEVRQAGQLVRAPAVTDILEPFIKLAKPPKEFRSVVKWLNDRAETLAGSRLFVAAAPLKPELPSAITAVELATPDEAKKFAAELRAFVPTLLPGPTPSPSPTATPADAPQVLASKILASKNLGKEEVKPEAPTFHTTQLGSLVLLSDRPFSPRDLKARGKRLLVEQPDFVSARNRFGSESVFFYVNIASFEKEDAERRKRFEDIERQGLEKQAASPTPAVIEEVEIAPSELPEVVTPEPSPPPAPLPEPEPETMGRANTAVLSSQPSGITQLLLSSAFLGAPSKWPNAVAAALAFDDEGYALRVLVMNAEENKAVAIPFLPVLVSGPQLTPAASSIFPADSELFVSMSLDYARIYESIIKASDTRKERFRNAKPSIDLEVGSPFEVYEKQLGIKIKDDLLPLLGNELAMVMPKVVEPPRETASDLPAGNKPDKPVKQDTSLVFAIGVKDREGIKRLIQKIIESVGFKGAAQLAQVERRDDTELVSYLNLFSYAFIGDFLVVAPDAARVRAVVDSYLSHQTLASNPYFRNSTRWQSRQLHGQVYIAPSMVDLYNPFGSPPATDEKLREALSKLNPNIDPVTYALTNDDVGPLHELHVPRNLLQLLVTTMSSEMSDRSLSTNESIAMSALRTVAAGEATFHSNKDGRYGTLDELIQEGLVYKDLTEQYGYRIQVSIEGAKFEATAIPIEYGKTGRKSFFIDETNILRGGDHGGGAATVADSPID